MNKLLNFIGGIMFGVKFARIFLLLVLLASPLYPSQAMAAEGTSCDFSPGNAAETLWTGSFSTSLGESFVPSTDTIKSVSLLIKPNYYMQGEPYNGTLKLKLTKDGTTLAQVNRTITRSYSTPGDYVFTFDSPVSVITTDTYLIELSLVGSATGTLYW